MDFWKQQFDKLLLAFLVVLFALLAWWAHSHNEGDLAQFSTDNIKLFIGALLLRIQSRTDPPPPIVHVTLPGGVTLKSINVPEQESSVLTTKV